MKKSPGEFSKKVISLALSIPPGRVTTYGLLAVAAGGKPILAQMITHILGKYPEVDKIPFHRIVYSDGRVWLSDNATWNKKRLSLYKKENILIDKNNKIIDFEKKLFYFN